MGSQSVLICPSARAGVRVLAEKAPLSTVPILGMSLIEYWLSHVAELGTRRVLVLAQDDPEWIEALVGNGARWGLDAEVLAEDRELTPDEAVLKHGQWLGDNPPLGMIQVIDHLPDQPGQELFGSYSSFFAAVLDWLPRARTPERVGVREVQPGVYVGLHSHIGKGVHLRSPCWIGGHVVIGAGAVLGPGAVIEDGALIEPSAEVVNSYVGSDTFVGSLAEIRNSLAWGSTLINWETGSCAVVPDAFLMCALRAGGRMRGPADSRKAATGRWLPSLGDSLMVWKHLRPNRKL